MIRACLLLAVVFCAGCDRPLTCQWNRWDMFSATGWPNNGINPLGQAQEQQQEIIALRKKAVSIKDPCAKAAYIEWADYYQGLLDTDAAG